MILRKISAIMMTILLSSSMFTVLTSADNNIEDPAFHLKEGSHKASPCSDQDAEYIVEIEGEGTVYYKQDSEIFSGKYEKYTDPIIVTEDSSISAYCVVGNKKSKVVHKTFDTAPQLNVSHKPGVYNNEFNLKIEHSHCNCVQTGKCEIYYTLDGSKPTVYSQEYDYKDGIEITSDTVLRTLVINVDDNKVFYNKYKYIVTKDSIFDKIETKYWYNTLNNNQKILYKQLLREAGYNECIKICGTKLNATQAFYAVDAFTNDNPQFFVDSFIVRCPNETAEQVVLVRNEDYFKSISMFNNRVLTMIDGLSYDNECDLIRKLHDLLCENVVYTDEKESCFNLKGAIVDGKAVCQGYASAFAYLCQLTGINCSIMTGKSNGEGHSWNIVKTDDGWMHVDVCWDDCLDTYRYFLKTEKEISKTHTVDRREMRLINP